MKLLVEITKYLHFKFDNSKSKSDRELKFCVSKHLQKMCLEIKFQPFLLRNDKDIDVQLDIHVRVKDSFTIVHVHVPMVIICYEP